MRRFWLVLFVVLGLFRPVTARAHEYDHEHDHYDHERGDEGPRVHLGVDLGVWYQYRDEFYSNLFVLDRSIFQVTGDLVLSFSPAKFFNIELGTGYAQGLNGDPIISYWRFNGALLFGDFHWFRAGPMLSSEFSVYNSSFPGFSGSSFFVDQRLIPGILARMNVADGFHLGASFGRAFLRTNLTDFEGEGWVATINGSFFFF